MKLSIIAYYLSKFDMDAVKALGYKNRSAAIQDISANAGKDNNFLKLRRDEFDVLTASHRRGYANRKPAHGVLKMHNDLKDINFDDFSNIVFQIINPSIPTLTNNDLKNTLEIDSNFSDIEIESIINANDTKSTILLKLVDQKTRVYNPKVIDNLKKLYKYRCQICEYSAQEYEAHIVEAHHIIPFSDAQNNDADNIIILCPNHHRIIHRANPILEREKKIFLFPNKTELEIKLNMHL